MKSTQEPREDLNTLYALAVPDALLVNLQNALAHLRQIKDYPALIRFELAYGRHCLEEAQAKIVHYQRREKQ